MSKVISLEPLQATIHPLRAERRVYFGLPLRLALVYTMLFAIALCVYSFVWKAAPLTAPDSSTYMGAAQDLADFHIDQLQERTPGYPLLLLLTGASQAPNRVLFYFSLLLHLVSIWLLASLLHRLGLTDAMLILFALILLLPPYVESSGYVLSENLTEATLVVGLVSLFFWTLDRKTIWILISTVAIGYAGITRPTYQILALAIVGYFMVAAFLFHWNSVEWKALLKASLILIFGSVALVGGYAYANYVNFGYFGLSPKLGLTLSQKTLRVLERLPDEYAEVREILVAARNSEIINGESHTGYSYIWNAIPALTNLTGLQYRQLSDYMLQINLLLIRKAPLNFLQDVFWAFCSFWLPTSDRLANLDSRVLQFAWAALHFGIIGVLFLNLTLVIGAGVYVYFAGEANQNIGNLTTSKLRPLSYQAIIYGLTLTVVFYTAVISSLIEVGNARYRVPTDALILFALFLGTQLWRSMILLRSNRR